MSDRKRAAETQLTRDDDDDRDSRDDRARETFITTPQVADAEELATRRMVTVKRPAPTEARAPKSTGFFANVAGAPAPAVPNGFSFGVKSTSGTAAPAFGAGGAVRPTAPIGFGFGANAPLMSAFGAKRDGTGETAKTLDPVAPDVSKNSDESNRGEERKEQTEAPKPTFSFGAPPTATASAASPKPFSFSFGLTPAAGNTDAAAKAPANMFSFSFGKAPAASPAATAGDGTAATTPAAPGSFAATGGFSFAAAVGTFKEAQQKLSEQQTANPTSVTVAGEGDGAKGDLVADEDDAPKLFAGKSSIATVGGDVLASGPGKLYIFEKKDNKWKEHGEGEARVKRDVVPAEDGKDDAKEETVYRLMVRDGYSLNAVLTKAGFVLSKEAERHIIFSVPAESGVETYLLKFTSTSGEANAKKITEEVKKALAASESSSS